MNYPVIAECVDARDGSRYFPGDTFPNPDEGQIERLTAAGCFPKDAKAKAKADADAKAAADAAAKAQADADAKAQADADAKAKADADAKAAADAVAKGGGDAAAAPAPKRPRAAKSPTSAAKAK